MNKTIVFLCICLCIPISIWSQNLENLDYIAPFHDGIAAVKKGKQWAFINTDGTLIMDFRSDLVLPKSNTAQYPKFNSDRCLIEVVKEGISYFGYIDKTGKTIIEPIFLNASPFYEDKAIVLKLQKIDLGRNEVLGKDVYRYKYFEVVIDTSGEAKKYLTDGTNIALSRSNILKRPAINSKFIAANLIATQGKDKQWRVIKME